MRDELELSAPRAMAVLKPLKVTLINLPADHLEILRASRHPNVDMGEREIPFTHEIFLDRSDFEEVPPKGFKRLIPGGEVRLRNAYIIRCDDVVKDADGVVVELKCSVDLATLGVNPTDRKVKGVVHWVSASHSLPAEVRVYDRLFIDAMPDRSEVDYRELMNPESLVVYADARVEPSLASAEPEQAHQFEREGYFCLDNRDASAEHLVFNRTVSLRDTWGKAK